MINAKQKAEELVKNIQFTQRGYVMPFIVAKQCALICVEEILNNFGLKCNGKHYCSYSAIQFYQQVKTEIENL